MFGLRKFVKGEFKKIANSFRSIKKDIVSREEIDLMIENALLKVQSAPNSESKSESNKKQFERVMIQKANKTRPELIKQAIQMLMERDLTTTNIFNVIVGEKKLCGKTQFYHYLSIVRAGLRTELRTKQTN